MASSDFQRRIQRIDDDANVVVMEGHTRAGKTFDDLSGDVLSFIGKYGYINEEQQERYPKKFFKSGLVDVDLDPQNDALLIILPMSVDIQKFIQSLHAEYGNTYVSVITTGASLKAYQV